jgi:hypothetical protein
MERVAERFLHDETSGQEWGWARFRVYLRTIGDNPPFGGMHGNPSTAESPLERWPISVVCCSGGYIRRTACMIAPRRIIQIMRTSVAPAV